MILLPRETVDALKPEPNPDEYGRGDFVTPAPQARGVVRTGTAQRGASLGGELSGFGRRLGGYARDLASEIPDTRVAMESGSRLINKYGGSGDYKPNIYDPLNVRGLAEVSTTPMLEGSRVGEAASLPVNFLPFGRGGSIAAKAATNVIGSVGGQLAAQGAEENLPQDMNPVVRGGLVFGANAVGFEGLTNPRLGGKVAQAGKRAATGYRNLTENIPVGMSVKDVGDAADDLPVQGGLGGMAPDRPTFRPENTPPEQQAGLGIGSGTRPMDGPMFAGLDDAAPPAAAPHIGFLGADGTFVVRGADEAEEAGWHHNFLFDADEMGRYNADSTLRFVKNFMGAGKASELTIEGAAATNPTSAASARQISTLAKRLIESGESPDTHLHAADVGLSGKSLDLGPLSRWVGDRPAVTPPPTPPVAAPPEPPIPPAESSALGRVTMIDPRTIKTRPDLFQNRDELDAERVKNLVERWDPNQLDPLRVVRDKRTGELIVTTGHHRLAASLVRGEPLMPANILDLDLANPAELSTARADAALGNLNAKSMNVREQYRSYVAAIESGYTVDDLKSLSGTTRSRIQSVLDIGEAGPQVLDRVVVNRQLEPIAAAVGSARRRWGFSDDVAGGWFSDFADAGKGKSVMSVSAVTDTLDAHYRAAAAAGVEQGDLFGGGMMAGFEPDAVRKLAVERARAQTMLERDLAALAQEQKRLAAVVKRFPDDPEVAEAGRVIIDRLTRQANTLRGNVDEVDAEVAAQFQRAKPLTADDAFEPFPTPEPAAPEPTAPPKAAPVADTSTRGTGFSGEAVLPPGLAGATPRYGSRVVEFSNDLDKAAYIVSSAKSQSKRHDAYRQFLADNGVSRAEITARYNDVRAQLKAAQPGADGKLRAGSGPPPKRTFDPNVPSVYRDGPEPPPAGRGMQSSATRTLLGATGEPVGPTPPGGPSVYRNAPQPPPPGRGMQQSVGRQLMGGTGAPTMPPPPRGPGQQPPMGGMPPPPQNRRAALVSDAFNIEPPPSAHLTMGERIHNQVSRLFDRAPRHEAETTTLYKQRAGWRRQVASVANDEAEQSHALLARAFDFNKEWGITSLVGKVHRWPAAHMQDVMAHRLAFERYLTPAQRTALDEFEARLARYDAVGRSINPNMGVRPDVEPGGSYLHRAFEDDPSRPGNVQATKQVGGKEAFEREAKDWSMGAAVGAGNRAVAPWEAMRRYINLVGESAIDDTTARATPRGKGGGRINLAELGGTTVPESVSDAANHILRQEIRDPGPVEEWIRAYNDIYLGLTGTMDDSIGGNQLLLIAAGKPKTAAIAARVRAKAWRRGGDKALGEWLLNSNKTWAARGLPDSHVLARNGAPISAIDPEFSVGRGKLSRLTNAPGVRQANRAFGTGGTVARIEAIQNDIASTMAKRGVPWQALEADGTIREISEGWALATGQSGKRFGGTAGDMALYSARYLQARIKTELNGMRGALPARGLIHKAIPAVGPEATRQQKIARSSLLKLITTATALTVAGNEAAGHDTDFRPFVDGKRNSNFMRLRLGGFDRSLLGPFLPVAYTLVMTGEAATKFAKGNSKEALGEIAGLTRGYAGGSLGNLWSLTQDVFTGDDGYGTKITDSKKHFAEWVLRQHLPFGGEDTVTALKQARKAAAGGSVAGAAAGVANAALTFEGFSASPLTTTERIQADPRYYDTLQGEEQLGAIPARSWQAVKSAKVSPDATPEYAAKVKATMAEVAQYGNISTWHDKTIENLIPEQLLKAGKQFPDKSYAEIQAIAQLRAEAEVDKDPVYKRYLDAKDTLETEWYKANQETARKHVIEELKKPEFERKNMPTQKQLEIIFGRPVTGGPKGGPPGLPSLPKLPSLPGSRR